MRKIQRYGWNPDLPDIRDYIFKAPEALKGSVDMRLQCPPIYDQLQLGSCTANAIAAALEFDQMKQKEVAVIPSRLFIYYNERVMEGTVNQDAGASIRDGMVSVNNLGACKETIWPYATYKFKTKPTPSAYKDALLRKSILYQRVPQTLAQVRGCLASGYPFIFGFTVYESFESDAVAKTGIVPMPVKGEAVLGGHAVLCVGYIDGSRQIIVRNSWGIGWGQKGYFNMPYAYLLSSKLASDFWTVKKVE